MIDTLHFSEPCTDSYEIDRLDRRIKFLLPEDLKVFYRRYSTVKLFDHEFGATYRFVPITEIHLTRIDIYGKDLDELGPSSWLTICDVLDGNYIAVDIASQENQNYNYIDCFHETFAEPGEATIVAKSFTELLERSLRGGGDSVYYCQKGFTGYGDGLELTAENATTRIDNPEAPKKGWLMKFTHNGICHYDFFIDDEFGGKEKAFDAVRLYIRDNS